MLKRFMTDISTPSSQPLSCNTVTGAHRRILVVDHDEPNRLMICRTLEEWGFNPVGIDNGLGVLALLPRAHKATAHPHEIAGIVLELDMPMLPGLAVLQELRDRHPDIPLLAMAEARSIEKLREAIQKGAREYLVKPCNQEVLRMKCAHVFAPLPSPSHTREGCLP